jgi:Domain of unknown function (DUF4129)
MTRFWNAAAAHIIDITGVLLFVVIVFALGALIGCAWHFYPRWLPKASWFRRHRFAKATRKRRSWRLRWHRLRWRGLRWPRWKRKKRAKAFTQADAVVIADDGMPDLSADFLRERADAYAAEGRFAEAVRERLRSIVRELVDAGVIPLHPDWTVTELARAAASARPALDAALSGASRVFSDIWYGEQPAHATHDQQMREHAATVHDVAGTPVGARR